MASKSNFKAHIKTDFGGSYMRAVTVEEARAKCARQTVEVNAFHAKKTGIKVVRAWITDTKGNMIEEVAL